MYSLSKDEITALFGKNIVESVESDTKIIFVKGDCVFTTSMEVDSPAEIKITLKNGIVLRFADIESHSIYIERLKYDERRVD